MIGWKVSNLMRFHGTHELKMVTLIHSWASRFLYFALRRSKNGHKLKKAGNSDNLLGNMQLKLSFSDWWISILSSKKCQTPLILADLLGNESFLQRVQRSLFVICDWWISIRFVSYCVSRFVACDLLMTKTRRSYSKYFWQISSLDFRLQNLDEARILKIQINFWDR